MNKNACNAIVHDAISRRPPVYSPISPLSQKLQSSCDHIHHALRRRSDAQHRMAPARDLRPPGICNDLSHQAQTHRLGLQQGEILLALDL